MLFVQPNMQQEEDLAALLSRNLTLDPVANPPKEEEPRIVYISQHYNHSAHIVKPQDSQPSTTPEPQMQQDVFVPHPLSPRPASEPPQPEHARVESVLRDHGVDSSGLSASQLQLFKTADEPQQRRLIELWRICPPTNSRDNPTLAWCFTTVDQEEVLARARFEEQQRVRAEHEREREQEARRQAEEQAVLSLDGTPLTPIQAGDGRWIATMTQHYMEPYMSSGYEEMARREYEESARKAYAEALENQHKAMFQPASTTAYSAATDPVYQNTNGGVDWRQQASMENQYGRMMQCREDEEML